MILRYTLLINWSCICLILVIQFLKSPLTLLTHNKSWTVYTLFLWATFFSTQLLCFFIFSRIEFQMLLRSFLIHITIIILRPILHLVYLRPCLGLGVFMSYLCILFLFFSLIFIVINHITSLNQMYLIFCTFLEYLLLFLNDNVDEDGKWFSNSKNSASGFCLAFAWYYANFSLALLIKVLLIKKRAFVL